MQITVAGGGVDRIPLEIAKLAILSIDSLKR